MPLSRLSEVLWRERHLLELLAFKLEEEHLVLSSGRARWLSHAVREVDSVLEELGTIELGRTIEADAVTELLGLPPGSSLRQIAEAAPAPWGELLRAHRQALCELAADIKTTGAGNRQLLATSLRAAQETLATFNDIVHTYDDTGASAADLSVAQLVDRSF